MDDDGDLLTLPRSVHLALWLAGPGPVPVRRVVEAVQGEDEPHTVSSSPPPLAEPVPLAEVVGVWGGTPRVTAAVLPVPGDVSGLPPLVAEAAVDAGECLLVSAADRSWVAVPEVTRFGSVHEVGHLVAWQLHEVPDWTNRLPGLVGTLSEAEQSLRHALREATGALSDLDVPRWRPDAAAAIATLRGQRDPGWTLPAGLPARALHVLAGALRLRTIVARATADDGGAVNLWQADQRSAALRHIDHAARRAVAAATFAAGGAQASTER